METKIFTIMAPSKIMRRLERFFALLNWYSNNNESTICAMSLDAKGSECIRVENIFNNQLQHEVKAISLCNFDINIAYDDSYSGGELLNEQNHYHTRPVATLYKNNEIIYISDIKEF